MLHAGLDLSRKKVDVCLLSEQGEHLDQLAVPPDVDSLRRLARRIEEVHRQSVCAVIESMSGARIVHDTLEQEGWSVEIADAQKVKGLAPLACKTDKIDSQVLATLSHATSCRRSGSRIRGCARSASSRAFGFISSSTNQRSSAASTRRSSTSASPARSPTCSGSRDASCLRDSRSPSPGAATSPLRSALIDDLERRIEAVNRRLREATRPPLHPPAHERSRDPLGACVHDRRRDRRDRALLVAGEARRLHGALPARRPIGGQGPPRAADQARSHLPALGLARGDDARAPSTPPTRERYQRTKRRLGKQRGAKVAQIDIARRLADAIWHMLSRKRPSLREAPLFVWRPDRPFGLAPASEHPISPDPPDEEAIET